MEDYPIMLTAVDLKEILKISKTKAYEVMEDKSFPLIKIGRNKRVLKNEFFQWLAKQQAN